MAKKKTAEKAKIEAAPVLRDGGGGQDPAKTKSYCIRDDWKDSNKVNYVAFKSVDGEVQDLTVNGEPAGGGGGGTATVQITANAPGRGVDVWGPVISNNIIMTDITQNQLWHIDVGASDTFTVPLASGGMQLFVGGVPAGINPAITGGGTWDEDNSCFIITGNCTITI